LHNDLKKAYLKKGKEQAILRRHPWVFSGAIYEIEEVDEGDLVEVIDSRGNFLAIGMVGDGSILIRIISFDKVNINQDFWKEKISVALALRSGLNLGIDSNTNTYRLIHGEGDGLPGLIIDIYGEHAVIQAHTYGMHKVRMEIAEALKSEFGTELKTVYYKSKSALHRTDVSDEFLLGDTVESVVLENNMKLNVNWVEGQKTGFFLDQRVNRALLGTYAKDKSVLNTFSYSGGFSISALLGGATNVVSVDVSKTAVELCDQNAELNNVSENHTAIAADVLAYLKDDEENYDIVVLDPPAFAKSLKKKHAATMGYKRLNALGIQKVKPGGLLFTFSCSQVIDEPLFIHTVTAAAMEVGRECQILHRLSQGPDHPVSIFHPEGHYLKGLVLRVI